VLIDSEEALAAGVTALASRDPAMAALVAAGIRPPLRKRDPGFASLIGIVVSQQVSTASAAAIWARLRSVLPAMDPETVRAASDGDLRAGGLSRPKMAAIRAIAAAALDGSLPLEQLGEMDVERAHSLLTAVKGVGPWTADVYLLFCLGHPDAFPAGDLAVQEAARLALGLPARPDARALGGIAERWRPWRGVAAGLLWAYYARVKARDGAPMPSADAALDADGPSY
jgi:DNA-3-methyladenine glycosylase II